MNHIIAKIHDIDFAAQQVVRDAEKERDSLKSEVEAALLEKKARYMEAATKKIAQITDFENQRISSEKIAVQEAHDKAMENLSLNRQAMMETWINSIFEKCMNN